MKDAFHAQPWYSGPGFPYQGIKAGRKPVLRTMREHHLQLMAAASVLSCAQGTGCATINPGSYDNTIISRSFKVNINTYQAPESKHHQTGRFSLRRGAVKDSKLSFRVNKKGGH